MTWSLTVSESPPMKIYGSATVKYSNLKTCITVIDIYLILKLIVHLNTHKFYHFFRVTIIIVTLKDNMLLHFFLIQNWCSNLRKARFECNCKRFYVDHVFDITNIMSCDDGNINNSLIKSETAGAQQYIK